MMEIEVPSSHKRRKYTAYPGRYRYQRRCRNPVELGSPGDFFEFALKHGPAAVLAKRDAIKTAKGGLEVLGNELYSACKGTCAQQQDIGKLTDERVAATGSDPSSILRLMMRVAIRVDNRDVIAFCLGRGALVDDFHMDVLVECQSFACHRAMIEAKAVDIDCRVGWYGNVLCYAVATHNLQWAEFCLEKGTCPNNSNVYGCYLAIAHAAEDGFRAMVELLLRFGAELRGSGAIIVAAAAGRTEMVRFLLEKGADVNEFGFESRTWATSRDIGTPLHQAIINGRIETAKLLIEEGANAALRDWQGRTPRILAKQHDQTGILSELLGEEPPFQEQVNCMG